MSSAVAVSATAAPFRNAGAFVLALIGQDPPAAPGTTVTTAAEPASGGSVEAPVTVCPESASWLCRSVYRSLGVESGTEWAPRAEWLVAKPLTILLILVVAYVLTRFARWLVSRGTRRLLRWGPDGGRRGLLSRGRAAILVPPNAGLRVEARVHTLTTVFRSVVTVAIWFVAVASCLQVLGVNVASLVAISSVVGVALGFGAQNIVRDFLAGTFIVLEDQFGVGDTVDIGGEARGTVEELTLRVTRVRDVHGTLWHVPNGQILRVANKSQAWSRAVLDLEVDGGTDYAQAVAIMERVARTMAAEEAWLAVILEPPAVWGVEAFTDAGYTIRLAVKTGPAHQFAVARELRIRLLAAFAEQGITLPGTKWSLERAGADADADEAEPSNPAPDPANPDPDPDPANPA